MGGAWGFDSEASAGDTVPTLDSIQRFMSPAEQAGAVAATDHNQYHANYEPELPNRQNGGYSFGTLYELDNAIQRATEPGRASPSTSEEAQVQNYETQRAEFEAYIDHSTDAADALDWDRLLDAQQGRADAALGSLQRGIRPGR